MDAEQIKRLSRPRDETPNVLDVGERACSHNGKMLFTAAADIRAMAQNLIEDIRDHAHLREAHVLIVMRSGMTPDADNRIELGKAKTAAEFLRLLTADGPRRQAADFIVRLNADAWPDLTSEQKLALMDHELSHCAATVAGRMVPAGVRLSQFVAALGEDHVETCHDVCSEHGERILVRYRKRTGEAKPGTEDYPGQPLQWRIRKHDVEEFVAVAGRWGGWSPDLRRIIDVMDPPDDGQLTLAAEDRGTGRP